MSRRLPAVVFRRNNVETLVNAVSEYTSLPSNHGNSRGSSRRLAGEWSTEQEARKHPDSH